MIRYLKKINPAGHPIGMTATFLGNRNEDLFHSPADWISPATREAGARRQAPPK